MNTIYRCDSMGTLFDLELWRALKRQAGDDEGHRAELLDWLKREAVERAIEEAEDRWRVVRK